MMIELDWMRPEAPYAPIAVVGLLALLESAGPPAHARWKRDGHRSTLTLDVALEREELAELIAEASRPDLERIDWPDGGHGQALKPLLKDSGDAGSTLRRLIDSSADLETRLLRTIVTDGALDNDGIPARSRLLRGVKADLSSAAGSPKQADAKSLEVELLEGPRFIGRESGLGLGLVPEIQTFGGTTGPDASSIGAYSPLLFLLLWQGILALPPFAVSRGQRRIVGGLLTSEADVLSWPRWQMPVDLSGLRSLLSWSEIHAEVPDLKVLSPRGIDAVYRTKAVPLSTMVAVFRWGEQVAR